jgi:hypothetical protein
MKGSQPLADGDFADPTLREPDKNSDPLASYKQGGLEVKRQLLAAEGGYYVRDRASTLLGISESALTALRQQSKIIGLPLADGNYVYPQWQFVKTLFFRHRLLKGLDRVLAALSDSDPWIQAAFLLDRLISTEMTTPLEGLRQGKIDLVIAIAKSFGDHGVA